MVGQLVHNIAPWVDEHGLSPRLAAIFMHTTLTTSQHITLVFYCTGAQQQFPMGLACGVGKRRRQKHHIKRQLGAKKLRKTHVVANALRHRDAVDFQLRHFSTGLYRVRLLIRFAQALKTKQMHFVIAPD